MRKSANVSRWRNAKSTGRSIDVLSLMQMRDWPEPIEIINGNARSGLVLICEHASRHIPAEYAGLGLSDANLERHIAWDIGAGEITRLLAERLGATAFLGAYSRLLIDLNRPLGVPSSIPMVSESTEIPGNIAIDLAEQERRVGRIFEPFHNVVAAHLDRLAEDGVRTRIVAMHSFTPAFKGVSRPWHASVLYEFLNPFNEALIAALSADPALTIGVNAPYTVRKDEDYAIPVHADERGIPSALIEIRQDLIGSREGVQAWADRLGRILSDMSGASGETVQGASFR